MRSECRRCELSPLCLSKGLQTILSTLRYCNKCGRMYLFLKIDIIKPVSPLCAAFELRSAIMAGRHSVVIEGITWNLLRYTCNDCERKAEEKEYELRRMSFEERLLKNRP
jgi:hypothetical protein